jgi:hypothetical protein
MSASPRTATPNLEYATPEFATTVERLGPETGLPPLAVVAIPVRDEAERIGLCLSALAEQEEVDMAEMAVVLLLNNTTDGTADVVRELSPHFPWPLELRTVALPCAYANAGWARKLAMDAAADWVQPGGLILTTDADTVVATDWVAANRREISQGVEAVAGYVMADPVELMELGHETLERGSLEWDYQQLAAELEARADPPPHDPWPRHNQNCGASTAITLAAYRRIGGLPPIRVGEDRALFEALDRMDLKVRHSLDVQVVTSARTDSRACGGLGDALRLRGDPDHPCDEALEVAVSTLRRAYDRAGFRAAWSAKRVNLQVWAKRLAVDPAEVKAAADSGFFGEAWARLEAISPKLKRRLVTGRELKRELRRMRRLVEFARKADLARRAQAAWLAAERRQRRAARVA